MRLIALAMPKITIDYTLCPIKLLIPNTVLLPIQKQSPLLPQILFGANNTVLI